jgi:imidazolonepropionase-like amidohydrolase
MSKPETEFSLEEALRPAAADSPVWLRVGTLFDGERTLRDAHVVYDGRKILHAAAGEPAADLVRAGQSAPDADLPEFTLLPGLIEAHAHLFLQGGELDFEKRKAYLTQTSEELLAQAQPRLETLIRLGVMAVRDAGDKDGVGLALSAQYKREHHPIMPYLESPGPGINRQGRYGSFMCAPLEEYESIEACVRGRVERGADRIKLVPTGIINFKEYQVTAKPQMSAEEVARFVAEAHALGRQTFAHASGADGIQNAIDGGVDTIEHGFFLTDEQLAQLRDRNIGWVPTFAPVQKQVDHGGCMGWGAETIAGLQGILDRHAASLARAAGMGVKIIAGSDAGSCGVAHGLDFIYELELMERAGMSAEAIIRSATGGSAERLLFPEVFGVIKPGALPRMILTKDSPLQTVSNLRKEKLSIFDGQVFRTDPETTPLEHM